MIQTIPFPNLLHFKYILKIDIALGGVNQIPKWYLLFFTTFLTVIPMDRESILIFMEPCLSIEYPSK